MDTTTTVIIVGFVAVAGLFWLYLDEKRNNLAVLKNVQQLADSNKAQTEVLISELKAFRSDLERQNQIHGLTSEREFQVLSQLWTAFADLQRFLKETGFNEGITGQMFMWNEQKYESYKEQTNASLDAFFTVFQNNKPFYPVEICELMERYLEVVKHRTILIAAVTHGINDDANQRRMGETGKELASTDRTLRNFIQKRFPWTDQSEN